MKAALSVPAFIPCTANTCSGYKWICEEFISSAVSGFCIPLFKFSSTEGYHSCFVFCCPSPSCALFLSLLQQSHLGIHKTPIKFSLPHAFTRAEKCLLHFTDILMVGGGVDFIFHKKGTASKISTGRKGSFCGVDALLLAHLQSNYAM